MLSTTTEKNTEVQDVYELRKRCSKLYIGIGCFQIALCVGLYLLRSSDALQDWALRNQWLIYIAIAILLGNAAVIYKYPNYVPSVMHGVALSVSFLWLFGTPLIVKHKNKDFNQQSLCAMGISMLSAAASFYPLSRVCSLRRIRAFALGSYLVTVPCIYLISTNQTPSLLITLGLIAILTVSAISTCDSHYEEALSVTSST